MYRLLLCECRQLAEKRLRLSGKWMSDIWCVIQDSVPLELVRVATAWGGAAVESLPVGLGDADDYEWWETVAAVTMEQGKARMVR